LPPSACPTENSPFPCQFFLLICFFFVLKIEESIACMAEKPENKKQKYRNCVIKREGVQVFYLKLLEFIKWIDYNRNVKRNNRLIQEVGP